MSLCRCVVVIVVIVVIAVNVVIVIIVVIAIIDIIAIIVVVIIICNCNCYCCHRRRRRRRCCSIRIGFPFVRLTPTRLAATRSRTREPLGSETGCSATRLHISRPRSRASRWSGRPGTCAGPPPGSSAGGLGDSEDAV